MREYFKFIGLWVVIFLLIMVATFFVPTIAKWVDKIRGKADDENKTDEQTNNEPNNGQYELTIPDDKAEQTNIKDNHD